MTKYRSLLGGAVALAVGTALGGVDPTHAELGTGGEAGQAPKGQAIAVDPRAFPALTLIYSASGVLDNGGASGTGVATTIMCTNWTGASQAIRFLIRRYSGLTAANATSNIPGLYTYTVSTHNTVAFFEDTQLSPGTSIDPGSLRIFATTPNVSCTAMVIDAGAAAPHGIDLHLVRHNVWPNTQE